MKLRIMKDPGHPNVPFWVVGEGFNFSIHCRTHEQARIAAQEAQRWHPEAELIDDTEALPLEAILRVKLHQYEQLLAKGGETWSAKRLIGDCIWSKWQGAEKALRNVLNEFEALKEN